MYERLEVPLCLYCYCTRVNVASVEENAGSYLSEVYERVLARLYLRGIWISDYFAFTRNALICSDVLSQGSVELARHNAFHNK